MSILTEWHFKVSFSPRRDFFLIARAGYRRYCALRDAPIDSVHGLRADLQRRLLCEDNKQIARLEDVRIDAHRGAWRR